MTLVAVAPSDELRAILCLEFDRRAPYDAVAKFKDSPCERAVLSSTHRAFKLRFAAVPRGDATSYNPRVPAAGKAALRTLAIRAVFRRRLQHRERSDQMKQVHYWMMCAAAGASVTVLGSAATAARAQTTIVTGERSNTEIVSYRDLDLAFASGQRALRDRVQKAVRKACRPNRGTFGDHIFNECASFAMEAARPQVTLALRRAREIAANGTSSIPLVAIAVVGTR